MVLIDALSNVGLSLAEVEFAGKPDDRIERRTAAKGARWFILLIVCCLGGVAIAIATFRREPDWKRDFQRIFMRAENYYNYGDYCAAKQEVQRALQFSDLHREPGFKADALFMAGKVESAAGTLDAAEQCFRQALTLRRAFGDELQCSSVYERLGEVQLRRKHFDSAASCFKSALDGFTKEGHAAGVAEAHRGLGSVHYARKEYAEALDQFDRCEKSLPEVSKADFLADLSGLRAMVFVELGRFEEARELLTQARRHWVSKGHLRWIASTDTKFGKLEHRAKRVQLARDYFQRAISNFVQAGDQASRREVEDLLAELGS